MEVEEKVDLSQSGFQSELQLEELSKEELASNVEAGLFYKIKDHKQHFAIHPFWLSQPETGILEELNKTLGKWSSRLEAYVVAYEKVRSATTLAAINEDHRWLHVDVLVTFYLYKPEEGQHLKGVIKKIGHQAAICSLFNVFNATVFPQGEDELQSWSVMDEIEFKIYSFQNRRKGPIIRGRSIGGLMPKNVTAETDNWEEENDGVSDMLNDNINWEENNGDLHEISAVSVSSPSKKKKKKKKKSPLSDEEIEYPVEIPEVQEISKKRKRKKDKLNSSENFQETEYPIDVPPLEDLSPKKKRRIKVEKTLDYTEEFQEVQELISSPSKKKKHKKHRKDV